MERRHRALLALALAALPLLAGCRLRADVELAVDGDGGGSLAVALEADEALAEEAEAAGYDLVGAVERAGRELEGWTAGAFGEGVRLETAFDDPAELRRNSAAFADALAAPELRPLDPFEVTVTDERVRVEGRAALRPTDQVGELGLDEDEALELLDDGVSYEVAVELPGEVLAHDADRQDGQRLVWEVEAGELVDVTAESERPRGPSVARVAGLAAAAGAGLLAAVIGLRRVRRRRWRS